MQNSPRELTDLEEKEQELQLMDLALIDLKQELDQTKQKLALLEQSMALMQNSLSWRITKPLRALRKIQINQNLQDDSVKNKREKQQQLNNILANHQNKIIIIFKPLVDWELSLFQRPHHLAKYLAEQNFLYFFCSPKAVKDTISGFAKIAESCYLTDQFELLLNLKHKKIIHLYSTDNQCKLDFIEQRLASGDEILYEYIDEIHPHITNDVITPDIYAKHFALLKNEKILCIATADKLAQDVKLHRSKNFALVTNGVDIAHFKNKTKTCPSEITHIIKQNKPVIGYFGALARWFDYRLVIKLAQARPDYEILLIGPEYDASSHHYAWQNYPNINILGPIEYKKLPQYASWFSVAMIPFLLNDITASTSPIKLFEYMALGKPIVTTDMPECRKYSSVLIGKNSEEFIANIDKAVALMTDEQYLSQLQLEAEQNSWQRKAAEIAALIRAAV